MRSSNIKNGEVVDADNVYVASDVVNCNNVEVGDVVVVVRNGSRSLIGKHGQIKKEMPNTVIGAFMTGLRSPQAEFVNTLLDTKQFDLEITKNLGATINQITTGAFKQMTFFVCKDEEEQTAIGTFFRTLDNTIAIYKRKLDGLRELKKSYLQVMFPQAGEAMPRVRFEGFSEDWESIELGNVFEQTARYVNPKEQNIELWSLTVENGLTPKTERYNREFLVKKDDAFKSVKPDEFIYNPMNMTLGAVDLNTTGNEVAVSGYYITMQTKQGYNNNYFAVWLKSPMAINLYKTYATGGLIEKQRVQFPTLAQIKVVTPSFSEQEAIGNFFNSLDLQIVTLSKKVEKLAQLKNAYLQKTFV